MSDVHDRLLDGPVLPGDCLLWEPALEWARGRVVVLWVSDDGHVSMADADVQNAVPFWNDISRVREACVRETPLEVAFLEALVGPDGDLARAAYADWLEEQGRTGDARAVRAVSAEGQPILERLAVAAEQEDGAGAR